jgi:hypothetical protein
VQNDDDSCVDKLILGSYFNGTEINKKFNERVFIIETKETFLIMTFHPCLHKYKASKFRAVVSKEGRLPYNQIEVRIFDTININKYNYVA